MLWDFERETIYSSDVILRFTEAFNYESIMSGRSLNSSIIVTTGSGGSVRQHTSSGLPNGVKFAGEESKDKMYEPKHTKKLVRVLTVVAYVFSVSLAAIMLSVYYVFLWNPKDIIHHRAVHLATPTPISPPGTACPPTMGASLQGQEKIRTQDDSMKAENLAPQSKPSSSTLTTSTQQPSINSTLDNLLET